MVDVEKLIEEVRKFPVLYDQSKEKYKNSEYKEKVWKQISITLEAKGGIEECRKKWNSVRDQLRRTLQKRKTVSRQAAVRNRKYKYEDILEFLIPHLVKRDTLSNVPEDDTEEEDEQESGATQEELTSQQDTNNINGNFENDSQSHLTKTENSVLSPEASSPTTSSASVIKRGLVGHCSGKHKIARTEKPEKQQESAASQVMAYILAQKRTGNMPKIAEPGKHPVDAFLFGIAPSLKLLNPVLLNEAKGRIFSTVQEFELRQLMGNHSQYTSHLNASNSNFPPFSSRSSSGSTVTTRTPYPSSLEDETSNANVTYYQLENQTPTLRPRTASFPNENDNFY